jgi:hypothetical protein
MRMAMTRAANPEKTARARKVAVGALSATEVKQLYNAGR